MEEKNTAGQQTAATKSMEERNMELYLYSLRKMAENNLESNRSFMTGLYNLRAFLYKAAEEMRQNSADTYAIIVMDISNFKSVNEFCGRNAGDELLKCIAEAFRESSSERAVRSHFRADIFAMLTPFTQREELVAIVKNIKAKIRQCPIPCRVLPAFGICVATDPEMPISLMQDYATMALKSIKGKFYADYAFFDEKMRDQMFLEKQIENDMVEALESGQFRLFVQPKVDMSTGEIIGGEALVRWQHPEKGIIGPAQFMPVLEKNGFIIDVDRYVWEEVFRFVGGLLEQGKKAVPISINISRLHAYDEFFGEYLIELKNKYNVSPQYVPLELTESAWIKMEETVYRNIPFLKENGFYLAMDDYGIGYSTMTMLKNQPVDEIKIDRSFIMDMSNEKSKIIVRNTIHMLRELDLDIIAEGVEEKEQQDFLLECGCKKAQGFYYYKPMPAEEFARLIR